ncbi:MAG: T9SS type A sorting domain-containing protein, partial [Bacteroidota bacterium]
VEVTAREYPVSLNLAQSGSPGRTFSATSASRVPFNMSRTGVYTLTATGPNNCTVERQVFLGSSGSIAIEIIQDGNGCEGPITLTALVSGSDTTGLTYNWSTGATEPTIVVDLVPGERENISVVVTSETGCINDAGISLAVDSLIDLRLPRVTEIPCGQDTATLIVPEPLPDYTYTWFGPLNQMLVGDSVRVTMTGWYEVVGQDNSGEACGYFGRTRVTDPNLPDGLFLEQFGSDSICGGQECFGVAGLANIDYEAVAFEWDGPAGFEASTDPPLGPFLCTTIPGDYTLTILGPCDTITLSYTYESQSCSLLSGTLWMDNAGNCALDSEDIPAPNFLIGLTEETSGRTYYTFTNGMGEWSLEVPIGTYLIEPVIQEGQPFTTCPNPTRVSLGDLPVSGVDLFLPVLVGCPQLSTSVSLPFLRRCFTNYVFIDYENTGSAVAEDAELTVTLDDFFLDAEPNIPPTNQDGQTYTFSLGDLPPFTNGRIFFLFRLSCQAQLGQAHCVEAAITPDAACLPDPNWSGALVDVTGSTCDGDSLYFQIENIGDGPMTIPLNYVVVEDGIMLSTEPIVNGILAIGEVMEVGVPAEGSTYLIITNQEPNAPGATQPTAVAEGCGTNANGEVTLGLANLWALNAGNPARTVECRENVGAYDPNDKTAIPTGYDDGNIPYGTRLTYDIRFQNTGTDTAFTVVIRDTISEALDLSTIKFEGASHPVSMSLDTHRVLTFTFENIQLPDSSVNLAASQGVVQFSIDHDSTLLRGSVINNEAAIYFDFNAPIITNISRRRIAKNGLPVGVHTPGILDLSVSVFPNPVDGRLFVKLPIEEMKTTDQLTVIDLYGRPLLSVPYGQSGNGLVVDGLPAGYYLLVVADASGRARGRAGFVKR